MSLAFSHNSAESPTAEASKNGDDHLFTHLITIHLCTGNTDGRVACSHRIWSQPLCRYTPGTTALGGFHEAGDNSMSDDLSDQARSTAVKQLRALGLSTYAARTFVALVSLGEGTAQDVSDAADVPRTRVYDAAEELRDRGLVDVKQSSPKQFWATSTETTGRHFEQEYDHRVTALTDALDRLETATHTSQQRGVWTVTGRDTVTERVVDFISTAEDEVVYVTAEELLTEEIAESLSRASDDGVSIRLAEMSQPTEDYLERKVPNAQPFESLWDWADTPAGRLLMVDREKTLASVLVEGNGEHPPESCDETAIWGTGATNSLVVVLKTLFTWQLDDDRE